MNTIVLGSLRGAPGVTTTAHLLAQGIDGSVLVEADLAGGVMAIRHGLGREPGLTTLAAAGPIEPGAWRHHAQLAGGVAALVGPDNVESAEALWRRAGQRLSAVLEASDATVVADAGRLSPATPLLATAALLVVLVRPVAEHLVALSHRLPVLRQAVPAGAVRIVLVGDGPYRPADVAEPMGVDVLGALPHDPRAAALLAAGSTKTFGRSRLARAATELTPTVTGSLHRQPTHSGVER